MGDRAGVRCELERILMSIYNDFDGDALQTTTLSLTPTKERF